MQLEELPTSAKTITKSPLGIIALFIFLIYSIASLVLGVSAQALAEGQKWVFVVFLVVFPLLVLGSFVWLVANHAVKLYSPADFRDDKSYVELNQKLQVVQVKQEAAQVDPRGNFEEARLMLKQLMALNQVDTAKSVTKAFLKVGRYSDSLTLFEEIGAYLKSQGSHETKVLSYKSYCLIGLEQYKGAMKLLYQLRDLSSEDFDFWPQMALAFCLWKEGKTSDSKALLNQAASDVSAKSYVTV
jgi:tetratricopeptide (TPR) repeat protein